MSKILEVCVDSYESALAAIKAGASRLELCSALVDGGLTPTPGLLKQVQIANTTKVPIFCMLRCRSSHFVYTQEESEIMIEDAKILKQNGADGFVFGALLENGDVDLKKCRNVIKTCYPLPVTFHRAFDVCRNPTVNLETIIDLGFQRILTSGQKKSVDEGVGLIKQLIKKADSRIIIMPGAGINTENMRKIIDETDATEYHGSFRIEKAENISNNEATSLVEIDLGALMIADSCMVAEIVQILNNV